MGLFRWLVIKVAGMAGMLPHQRVRPYKVTLFGETLGTFTLPIGDHMADPQALVRPVLTKPFKVDFADYFYFYWVEPNPAGGFKSVTWQPEMPEAREEAKRFFNTAHGLFDDGTPNPELQPPLSTRTTEEIRYIRAIVANRAAEQPYLDYAAWLTAKGDATGDYIRLTFQIEKQPEGDKQRERLEERRQELVQKHGAKWVRPLTDIGLFPGFHWGDFDGFAPDSWHGPHGVIEDLDVPCDTAVFPYNLPRLFYGAPFLRKLYVNDLTITVAHFATLPQMAQIESLSLSVGNGTEDDFRRFAASPHLGGLRELKLHGYGFGPAGAGHLARAAWLTGVQTLDLGANAMTDDGAEAFAESPNTANLAEWSLRYNEMSDRGLIALCRSPHLARLAVLNLEGNTFTAEGVRALPAAAFASALKSLNLSGCSLPAEALAGLAAGTFPALTTLDVSYSTAGDAGLHAVSAAAFFRNLEIFRANSVEAGDATAEAIAAAGFISLRELEFSHNQLTDAGVATLIRSKAATKLTKLKLNGNPFGLAGVAALAETALPLLEELDLREVRCTPAGATALVASPHFKNLKRLWISEEHVGLRGREALLQRFTDQVVSFS